MPDLTSIAQEAHNKMMETDMAYRLEFAMDIFKEEISWSIPCQRDSNLEERIQSLEDTTQFSEPPEWSRKQWDYVQQLKGEIKFLENKLNQCLQRKKKRRGIY